MRNRNILLILANYVGTVWLPFVTPFNASDAMYPALGMSVHSSHYYLLVCFPHLSTTFLFLFMARSSSRAPARA